MCHEPNLTGNSPAKLLLDKSKASSCVKSPISLGIVEPVVLSPTLFAESNLNLDRHLDTFVRERNLQAICSGVKEEEGLGVGRRVPVVGTGVRGASVVGAGVGGDNEELLAEGDDRP